MAPTDAPAVILMRWPAAMTAAQLTAAAVADQGVFVAGTAVVTAVNVELWTTVGVASIVRMPPSLMLMGPIGVSPALRSESTCTFIVIWIVLRPMRLAHSVSV